MEIIETLASSARTAPDVGDVLVADAPLATRAERRATGYVLVQTESGACAEVAAFATALPGVAAVHQVSGPYDLIVHVSDGSPVDLADVFWGMPRVNRALPCTAADGSARGHR